MDAPVVRDFPTPSVQTLILLIGQAMSAREFMGSKGCIRAPAIQGKFAITASHASDHEWNRAQEHEHLLVLTGVIVVAVPLLSHCHERQAVFPSFLDMKQSIWEQCHRSYAPHGILMG